MSRIRVCDKCGTTIPKDMKSLALSIQCMYGDELAPYIHGMPLAGPGGFDPDETYDLCNKCSGELARLVLRPDTHVVDKDA